MAGNNFSTARCQIPGDQGVIWCYLRVPTVMMILLGCQILPSAVALICVFFPLCEQHRERKLRGTMREWVFGTGPICPCPVPQSHGPGQTRQSPAGHGQLTHRGLDGKKQDALIKPMMFLNFLCMDAIIAVCQRVVSHASRVESHGHLLQGGCSRGASCPESTEPAACR